jgi:glutaredoxin
MSGLIKFERKNCAPCKLVGNTLKGANIPHTTVDVEEQPELAAKYRIMSVPTIINGDDVVVGGGACMTYIMQLNAKGRE